MKEHPAGHRFYKDKGLEHVEGKIPGEIKRQYEKVATKKKWSMIDIISDTLIKHVPKR